MGKACLKCCSCLCCCLLVITNIVALIIGIVLTLLGVLLTFGFSMLSSVLESVVTSLTSTITDSMKSSMNIDIDIFGLLKNISTVTGSLGAALMVLGIIIMLLGCFGCCGACCKAKACLLIYAVIVGIIFLAQVIVVIMWFADSNTFKSSVKTAMEESVKEFTGISSKNIQSLMQNLVQIFVECCGVNNGTDFETMSPNWDKRYTISQSGYNYTFNLTYPLTCCKFNMSSFQPVDTYCPYNNTNTNTSNYQKGCYNEFFNFVDKHFQLNTMFYALGGILGFQALLIAGAIIMHRASDDSNKVKPG